MMKSLVEVAVPEGVLTLMRPDPVLDGTSAVSALAVPDESAAYATLKRVRSFESAVSKFVPVMVTDVPATPAVGVNPVMLGARLPVVTTNELELVEEPAGAVTPIAPVVAPAGTLTTNCVVVAPETVAATPLNVTVFWLAVAEKPLPRIVTVLPIAPLAGEKEMTTICAAV